MAAAQQFISFLLANPEQTLIGGLAAASLLVLYEAGGGISIRLPGRRRFGLAALTAVASALIYSVQVFGVQGILDRIASDILSFGVIAVFLAWLLKNRMR